MLEKTFSYSLTSSSPRVDQPPHIQVPLRNHQFADLYAMKEKELSLRTGYPFQGDTFFSTYAILGDAIGSGKTITTLAHISQMALVQPPDVPLSNLHPSSTSAFFSILPEAHQERKYQNLIVVPHILFRQWQDSIQNTTTLKSYFLKSLRDLDRDDLVSKLQSVHVTLISNTLFPSLITNLKAREASIHWQRIFYDQADTIKLSSTHSHPIADFTWMITASYGNLLFCDSYVHAHTYRQLPQQIQESFSEELQTIIQEYISNRSRIHFFRLTSKGYFSAFAQNQHPSRWLTVVRCAREFLNQSFELPSITRTSLLCQMPSSYRMAEQALPQEAIQLLHAGDIPGTLSYLGVESHTHTTFIDAVCAYKQKELQRLRTLYAYRKQETYATPQARFAALQSLETSIQTLEEQQKTLYQRLETVAKDGCGICFEQFQEKLVTPCCSKGFCANCILEWAARSTTCPLCRKEFHPSALINIGYTVQASTRECLPNKIDAFCKLLHENPTGRFIVYCHYEFPLTQILGTLGSQFSAAVLEGNKDSIANKVKEFSAGKLTVLLLTNTTTIAGLNIQNATHIILWHRMRPEDEQQIIGRAYSLGRKGPLTVVQMLHEQE